nr:cadmium resistance 6 protein [Kandelia obovata]
MEDSSVRESGQSQHYHEQVVEINYTGSNQQDQYQPQLMAHQQQQQDYQPPQQQQQQSQAEQYATHPQTNQAYHEPTIDTSPNTDVDVTVQVGEINYTDSSQQEQYQTQFMAQQQDYQPLQQQQQQLMQQQSQAQQNPTLPQTNQAYGALPAAGPMQFPSPAPGPQPIPSQPIQFPPQNRNQPTAYPPQPAQFPPQNPTEPASYPPQAPQSSQAQPVQFPPRPSAYPPQRLQNLPNQPIQYPPQRPEMNPVYPSGPKQPVTYPPQPTSGIYPPPGQAFTQAAYQSPQPTAFSSAQQGVAQGGVAQGYIMAPPQYKPTAQAGISLEMNQTPQQQNYNEPWTTGLFDCMDDPNNALITALFPCVTFGQIAEIVDNGQTTCSNSGFFYGLIAFCIAMPCLISCGYRTKLRARYGLVEDPGPDWAVHCIFEWCALCQEYRELQNRGLDPAIGWQGNVMRQSMQQQQVSMMPPMNQQMMP